MAGLITHFDIDEMRTAQLRSFQADNGGGDPAAEWPGNVLSRHAVAYGSGRIARRCETVRQAVDPDELDLCRRLADEAAGLMAGVDSFGSGPTPHEPFFVAANADEPAPTAIDEGLVRSRFGGTLFSMAEVVVEPLAETGPWWDEVIEHYEYDEEDEEETRDMLAEVEKWRAMVHWFRGCPDFVTAAYVRAGDNLEFLSSKELPAGSAAFGCVVPHMALGLTRGGSLAGFIGSVVRA